MMWLISIFILITVLLYVFQTIWIYRDCKRREDELAWIWCILSLISCPLVFIIYLIFTRYTTSSIKGQNRGKNIYSSTGGYNKCGNCGFTVEMGWNYCPNCNCNLQNHSNIVEGGESYMSIKSNKRVGVAVVIFVAGIAAFACFLTFSLLGIKNSIQHVTVPGTSAITLKDAGKYTVFYEYNGNHEKLANYSKTWKLNVTLTDKIRNQVVPISKASSKSNYSFIGHSGSSFLEFSIENPGTYELSAVSQDNTDTNLTLALIQGFTSKILITVFGSLIILFATILVGILIIVSGIGKTRTTKF